MLQSAVAIVRARQEVKEEAPAQETAWGTRSARASRCPWVVRISPDQMKSARAWLMKGEVPSGDADLVSFDWW